MQDPVEQLRVYGRLGVVIDTNLLLLLFLGAYDRKQLTTSSRLRTFAAGDFDLLVRVLRHFQKIVTTPNILTEVSNLSNSIPEGKRASYFALFASRLALLEESFVSSSTALANRWARFGLTDAGIAVIAKNRYLVLTDDFRLSQALQTEGIDTLNFNHLRDIDWRRTS